MFDVFPSNDLGIVVLDFVLGFHAEVIDGIRGFCRDVWSSL